MGEKIQLDDFLRMIVFACGELATPFLVVGNLEYAHIAMDFGPYLALFLIHLILKYFLTFVIFLLSP